MRVIARSLVVIFVALIAVPALAVSVTITTAVQLLATTALIMGGTEHPLSTPPDDPIGFIKPYMGQAVDNFIEPAGAGPVENRVAVIYPAEFFPVFGWTTFDDSVAVGRANLSHCLGASVGACSYNTGVGSTAPNPATDHFIVFGYSQSAVVASLVKGDLINNPNPNLDGTEFVMAANPTRPNGGILARGFEGLTIPVIGITFYGPTENSCPTADPCSPTADPTDPNIYPTVDVAQQYDLLGGDAPAVPYNILAWANSLAAYALLHGQVPTHSLDDPDVVYQGAYGDTRYYMIDSDLLPILMVLEQAGIPRPILAVANAPLQVLVESAYYRDISPGQQVGFQLLPSSDPITLTVNLVKSIPVGIDDGLEAAGVGRVLGTTPAGLYGVGGPETPADPNAVTTFSEARGAAPAAVDPAPTPQGPMVDPAPNDDPQQLKSEDQPKLDNDTPNADTPPKGAKPRPFQLLRGPIEFDRPKAPSGIRPSSDGPLKRIVNALTGQRPDSAGEPEKAAEGEQQRAA